MALLEEQKVDILLKKFNFSVASTGNNQSTSALVEFFEENFASKPAIFKDQVWTQSDELPTTNPLLAEGVTISSYAEWDSTTGISTDGTADLNKVFSDSVLKKIRVQLNHIAGTSASFRLMM